MNITFDSKQKQEYWELLRSKLPKSTCVFCGAEITSENFAGALYIDDEFRAFDGELTCLMQLTGQIKKDKDEIHSNT